MTGNRALVAALARLWVVVPGFCTELRCHPDNLPRFFRWLRGAASLTVRERRSVVDGDLPTDSHSGRALVFRSFKRSRRPASGTCFLPALYTSAFQRLLHPDISHVEISRLRRSYRLELIVYVASTLVCHVGALRQLWSSQHCSGCYGHV